MIRIILLIAIILIAINGIYSDGSLYVTVINQEYYTSSFVKLLYLIIAIVASIILFYAIIREYGLMDKLETKKTDYQIQLEKEQEEYEKEQEELKKQEEQKAKIEEKSKERMKANLGAERGAAKKTSKLG